MAVTIVKNPGDEMKIILALRYSGPARTVQAFIVLASGKQDPVTVDAKYRWSIGVALPATVTPVTSTFPAKVFGTFPADLDPAVKYDINVSVGPPIAAGQTFTDWYTKRLADDWDDEVFQPATFILEIDDAGTIVY